MNSVIHEAPAKVSNSYGRRGMVKMGSPGVRTVASTFGTQKIVKGSPKCAHQFEVESHAESVVVDALNIDPTVESFKHQPFSVNLIDECLIHDPAKRKAILRVHHGKGVPILYTPDFYVKYNDGTIDEIVEVKSEAYPGDKRYQSALNQAQEILATRGIGFRRVVIPESYRCNPFLRNLGLLSSITSQRIPDQERVRIESSISSLDDRLYSAKEIIQLAGLNSSYLVALLFQG